METIYRVEDLQGGGLMRSRVFESREQVREALASFHSVDVENTESMTLEDLCEIGCWEVVESQCTHIFAVSRQSREKKCKACGLVRKDSYTGL